jgi:NAD+ synthase (glutamine-hydrolysing)
MTRIRVGAAVLNQTPLDWAGNQERVLDAIQAARAEGVRLLCLPELCLTGYGCEDQFHSAGLQEEALRVLRAVVPQTGDMIVCLGLPLLHRSALFDVACLAVDGRIAGFVAKRYLAGEGLHYEPRWFKPWPVDFRDTILLDGQEYPIGDLVFDCGGVKIGFEICEEAWVAKRPGGDLSLQGIDVILNPSASHFAFGKYETRKRFVIEGSRAFSVNYLYANLLGNEAGRIIYDGGVLIAAMGKLLAAGPRFSYQPVRLTTAVIDVQATRMNRARTGSFQPDLTHQRHNEVFCPFTYPNLEPEIAFARPEPWELSPHLKEEEFLRAISLALFDYLRKSRSWGFVVSLSGGADSSAVSCLVALMVELAAADLGPDGFRRALAYIPAIQAGVADSLQDDSVGNALRGVPGAEENRIPPLATERHGGRSLQRNSSTHFDASPNSPGGQAGDSPPPREPAPWVRHLLHCVYQATRNSSRTTRDAATGVARAIGAAMSCLEIDELVDRYVASIEGVLGRKLSWGTDDLAMQNIQARVRAPSVWLLANVHNALLLSTSNRSEAAVGYATMDGDTAGGLCPIAGIDKAFLRRWLRWLEVHGPVGLHPIPALAVINDLPPTAELRPLATRQTDEDDLMPYEVLDAIERSAIRDKQTPVEIFRLMRTQFSQYSVAQLHLWVGRFFRLWCRNQWKRERYAPSFHVDDENLDPKTWCRFPILSGGFERELQELRVYVESLEK